MEIIKKFEFSLTRMLKYKDTMLRREKDALHALHARRLAQEQHIAATQEQLLARDRAMKQDAIHIVTAAQMQSHGFTLESTRRLLEQLEKELGTIHALVAQQTTVVLGLSQEVSGLEKLEEKQRQEYDYEANREESERILEMVSGQYIAAQSE